MKSILRFENYPPSLPVLADDVLEFHAARLLLLIKLCGRKNTINGLTKLAKLDFFVRYPKFFESVCRKLKVENVSFESDETIESHMIRFHYGPWDQRYYHVLAYLESKRLIAVESKGNTYVLSLTELGQEIAFSLDEEQAFESLKSQMLRVNAVLGNKRGTELKKLIYELLDEEVAQLPLERIIK